MDILLKLSIVLAVGIIGGKLASLVKLPNISGYLVMGLLLGPSLFNLITPEETKSLEIISELALSFIAFSIGSEFLLKDMLKYGKKIFVITVAEVLGAILLVFVVMYVIFAQDFAFSIVIASMSAATAPAATLLVIRQYRANGPLTRTLLPVVALDDVFGIMAFGIALSLGKMSVKGESLTFVNLVLEPMWEIVGALVVGFVIGFVLTFILKRIKGFDDLQVVSLAAIGFGIGISKLLGLSPLLLNIMTGATLVNLMPKPEKTFTALNNFVPSFFVLFFTLAGATLDLSILKDIGLMGLVYVIARGLGKYLGSYLGGKAVKAEKAVVNYLGLGLLPQGGISIGLSVLVRQQLPEYATVITSIIMFSILIYETTGPVFAKIAIQKAGEIGGMDRFQSPRKTKEIPEVKVVAKDIAAERSEV